MGKDGGRTNTTRSAPRIPVSNQEKEAPRLRLVVGAENPGSPEFLGDDPSITGICETFSRTTGWPLHYCVGDGFPGDAIWSRRVAATLGESLGMFLLGSSPSEAILPRKSAEELALRVFEIVGDLVRARRLIREREDTSSPAIPPRHLGAGEGISIADQLNADLLGAQSLLRVDAVALYLLDEGTQFLNLRAAVGLNDERFSRPPRLLRGAKGDLQALTGHAVVIEDPEDIPFWHVPEACRGALCVPVSSANTVLGTLWCYAREGRGFSPEQVLLLEMVAGKIAAEVEREAYLRELTTHPRDDLPQGSDQVPSASATSAEDSRSAPIDSLFVPTSRVGDGWDLAGLRGCQTETGSRQSISQIDLRHLSGNRLSISAVRSMDEGADGIATANLAFGAIRGGLELSPAVRLRHAHQVLLETSTGELMAGAFAGDIDLRSGIVTFAAAGGVQGYVVRPFGWEPVLEEQAWLGDGSTGCDWPLQTTLLQPSDWLLLILGNPLRHMRLHCEQITLGAAHLAETLLRHNHLSARGAAESLGRLWETEMMSWRQQPSLILMKREVGVVGAPLMVSPTSSSNLMGSPSIDH